MSMRPRPVYTMTKPDNAGHLLQAAKSEGEETISEGDIIWLVTRMGHAGQDDHRRMLVAMHYDLGNILAVDADHLTTTEARTKWGEPMRMAIQQMLDERKEK